MANTKRKHAKKSQKRPSASRYLSEVTGPKYQVRKKLRTFHWKLLIAIVLLTMAALTVQHIGLTRFHSPMVMNVYLIIVFVTLVLFLIFNRGFRRGGTPKELLPGSWTEQEKEIYLAREAKNQRIARVFMTLMIPFAFVIIFDYILIVLNII